MKTITINEKDFELLNANTKKAKEYLENWKRAKEKGYKDLDDVYGNYSESKEFIYNQYLRICHDLNGHAMYGANDFYPIITTFNKFTFTLAFAVTCGEFYGLAYITPNHDYFIQF